MDNWEKLEYYIYESEEIYMILNFDEAELKERGGLCTLSEIQQQSIVFSKVLEIAKENSEAIALFFQKNKIDKANTRIIFTGAGTSEFVGNSLSISLQEKVMTPIQLRQLILCKTLKTTF
jgi:hypothetical protein